MIYKQTTTLLHIEGLALGYAMLAAKHSVWWPRVIGAGSALLGVGLLSGFFA